MPKKIQVDGTLYLTESRYRGRYVIQVGLEEKDRQRVMRIFRKDPDLCHIKVNITLNVEDPPKVVDEPEQGSSDPTSSNQQHP